MLCSEKPAPRSGHSTWDPARSSPQGNAGAPAGTRGGAPILTDFVYLGGLRINMPFSIFGKNKTKFTLLLKSVEVKFCRTLPVTLQRRQLTGAGGRGGGHDRGGRTRGQTWDGVRFQRLALCKPLLGFPPAETLDFTGAGSAGGEGTRVLWGVGAGRCPGAGGWEFADGHVQKREPPPA